TIPFAVSSSPGTVCITSPSSWIANSSFTFPALYLAVLLNCAVFDLVTSTLRPKIRLQIGAVLMTISTTAFSKFSPLAYGDPWTKTKCSNAQWIKTWDFACDEFLDEVSTSNNSL
ncbi:hypothetical protein M405DRAFT_820560, partial [Rhizopogon salebrosus TDB-379]